MDGADHYDEYGNYIGPALDTSSDEDSDADLSMGGLQSDAAADEGGAAASAFANDLLQRDDIDGPVVRMDLTVVDSDALAQRAPPPGAYGVGSNAIVLAEDKQYYPDASQVYGDGVETLVEEEDAQPLSVPIVAPVKRRKTTVLEEDVVPETTYSTAFMAGMLAHPRLARNVAVVGHIHAGKTTLLDLLVEQTHVSFEQTWPLDKERRWTDTRVDEQARGMSIKSSPVSLVLPTSTGKSYLLNLMDCPGHANFSAETTAAIRVSDGCVVVLDACEGIMMHTEQAIREAVANEVPVCLVVSKMDRLITELKLPPNDAYYKLRYMIGRVNEIISESFAGYQNLQVMRSQSRNGESAASKSVRGPPLVSPELGNVCFASGRDRWCFSLESFAYRVYSKHGRPRPKRRRRKGGSSASISSSSRAGDPSEGPQKSTRTNVKDYAAFAKNLWGDKYFDPTTGKIVKQQPRGLPSRRTFVQFVLEPLWKLYGQILGENAATLRASLEKDLGVSFGARELDIDPQPLLRLVLRRWMGEPGSVSGVSGAGGFVGMVADHVPSPVDNAATKVRMAYTGSELVSSERAEAVLDAMRTCDPNGPLMINVVKLYPVEEERNDGEAPASSTSSSSSSPFLTFGRVMSGTVRPGQRVRVLGEHYSERDDLEDMAAATVESVAIGQGRYQLEVDCAPAGCWVMLRGVDGSITHTATICDDPRTVHNDGDVADFMYGDAFDYNNDGEIQATFRPLQHMTKSIVRVSLEPRNPTELPRMVAALRVVCKSYPLLRSRVEESGEHVLLGTGEMHLDCALHDLRSVHEATVSGGIEIKLSDPVVSFCETVSQSSSFQCTTETPNGKNRISAMAEPLERELFFSAG